MVPGGAALHPSAHPGSDVLPVEDEIVGQAAARARWVTRGIVQRRIAQGVSTCRATRRCPAEFRWIRSVPQYPGASDLRSCHMSTKESPAASVSVQDVDRRAPRRDGGRPARAGSGRSDRARRARSVAHRPPCIARRPAGRGPSASHVDMAAHDVVAATVVGHQRRSERQRRFELLVDDRPELPAADGQVGVLARVAPVASASPSATRSAQPRTLPSARSSPTPR